MSASFFKTFDINTDGMDYVVGDIHGEFTRLEEELTYLKFDPRVDRLFSVGDLVDRGPESNQALEWLAQPWFHAVLGNHEELVLTAPGYEGKMRNWIVENGGGWWLDQSEERQRAFIDAILDMPLAIEVMTPEGPVGIVHADVPRKTSWVELVRKLESGDQEMKQYILWSRNRVRRFIGGYRKPVPGVHHIFCGHSPLDEVRTFGNVVMIDTGACYGGRLTVTPLYGPHIEVD